MPIVFPNAQAAAIRRLIPYVPGGEVFPELPAEYTGDRLVAVVTAVPGPRHDYVLRQARITVDVYGPDQFEAGELAEQLNALLLDWWTAEPIVELPRGGGDVSGPQWWPDGETRWNRYVFTVAVVFRGEQITLTPVA